MKYIKIPTQIKLGGQVLTIKNVERCDNNSLGETCVGAGYIEIPDKFNKDNTQCETSKHNTFYHELTHAILDTMGEKDLSGNERFVCCFSGFLADAMDKAYFLEDE